MTPQRRKAILMLHPFANPRYTGGGRRYFNRSVYVPHQGAKEIAKRAARAHAQKGA